MFLIFTAWCISGILFGIIGISAARRIFRAFVELCCLPIVTISIITVRKNIVMHTIIKLTAIISSSIITVYKIL